MEWQHAAARKLAKLSIDWPSLFLLSTTRSIRRCFFSETGKRFTSAMCTGELNRSRRAAGDGSVASAESCFSFFFFFLPARSDLTGRVLVFLLVLAVAGSLDFIAPSSSKDNCSRQKDCLVKSTTCWRNYRS